MDLILRLTRLMRRAPKKPSLPRQSIPRNSNGNRKSISASVKLKGCVVKRSRVSLLLSSRRIRQQRRSQSLSLNNNLANNYAPSIRKLLRQIHPGLMIDNESMKIMNSIMNHVFGRLATVASLLVKNNFKKSLRERDVEFATYLIFSGQLSKCAAIFGKTTLTSYKDSVATCE